MLLNVINYDRNIGIGNAISPVQDVPPNHIYTFFSFADVIPGQTYSFNPRHGFDPIEGIYFQVELDYNNTNSYENNRTD